MSDRATTKILMQTLERHYINPNDTYAGGIFIPECGVNGEFGAGSRCDALYVGFTAASSRLLVGHEVKASRSDWLRELAKVGKADFWADNCHAWNIVAPDTSTVKPDELPHGWGLLTPTGRGRMKTVVRATVHPDRTPSWDVVRSVMARLDTLQGQAMLAVHQTAREAAEKRVQTEVERRVSNTPAQRRADDLQALINRIQDELHIEINDWSNRLDDGTQNITPERLGEALRLLDARDQLGAGGHRRGLRRTLEVITEAQGLLTAFATELDTFIPATAKEATH